MAPRRIALVLSVLLLAAGWLPAREGVWTWVKDPVECPELDGLLYMAYDESRQQPALLVVQEFDSPWYHALFHYDGRQWHQTWKGTIDPTVWWTEPMGFYYDPEIHQLAYVSLVTTGPEQGFMGIYRYREGAGWTLGAEANLGPRNFPALVAYDTNRKLLILAAMVNPPFSLPLYTVEFDGQNFVQKPMPEGIELLYGSMGYYPETGKIIFFGENNESSHSFETFAYDGNTWTQLATQGHPTVYATYSGMIYHPGLHGLVAVRDDFQFIDFWLFKDYDWHFIAVQDNPSPRIDAAMAYFPEKEAILLTGGTARTGRTISTDWAFDTWQLRRVIHSKPLSNPKGK